ncbi:MAG TPA: YdeI/OmpD-associated family protein, partial [Rhizobiaceae bacterium]|nr:YdeI/OmpD-associated family protein [Rhizobiaceae bacterium]
IRPPKDESEVDLPDELQDALDANPELGEAFHRLTPGRQKSYVINLASAKSSATRISRIEKLRPKILEGKGANER